MEIVTFFFFFVASFLLCFYGLFDLGFALHRILEVMGELWIKRKVILWIYIMEIDIEQGIGTKTATEAIDILVKSYKSSITYQQVSRHTHKKKKQVSRHEICKMEGGSLEMKEIQASFLTQCVGLTKRSFVNMYRDLGYYWLHLAIYVAISLCIGTIYTNIGYSFGSIQERGSMLIFISSFLTFMTIGGFPFEWLHEIEQL
ncbi:ABC transporter G family member 1-like [Tasmannia lanceolata]|uniref:ABC transporter G family member 1-like n=1 Tax=Tasmannia lanceolata TaxID=3420 RepID=UPI0040644993